MTTDAAARLITIDRRIEKLQAELRELGYRATAVSGSAMEELIAERIESAEDQLKELQAARTALALPPADSLSFEA